MTQYLLSIIQPEGAPSPELLERVMRQVGEFNRELEVAGAFVSTTGLAPASTATMVRFQNGASLITDGPFAEGKEHVGGFWIIAAPDLDAALAWGGKAARATTLPIEVRPVREPGEH